MDDEKQTYTEQEEAKQHTDTVHKSVDGSGEEPAGEQTGPVYQRADLYTDMLLMEEPPAVQAGYFRLFALPSLLYAAVYTVCMFRNSSGITMPVWILATIVYACTIRKKASGMKPEGVWKTKISGTGWICIAVMLLLGIATCLTDHDSVILFNYIGFFLMLLLFLMRQFYDDSQWDFTKSLAEMFAAVFGAVGCMFLPFTDGHAFCREKNIRKNKTVRAVLIGVMLAVPALLFLGFCLACADAVFDTMIGHLMMGLRFPVKAAQACLMLLFGFFSSYCGMRYLSRRCGANVAVHQTAFDPVIAMTFTGLLLLMYLVFCGVQILYLFAGGMNLPQGMTYAQYAQRGFYMLLFVCLVNFVLVLLIRKYFAQHKVLDTMLICICACTFLMMASSAYRMVLYISVYQLTFLRVLVLAALGVLALLMAGVVLVIVRPRFLLFRYSIAVVSAAWLCLAFSHVDAVIASYNLSHAAENPGRMDWQYLSRLSLDAAPVIADYYEHASADVQKQLQEGVQQAKWKSKGLVKSTGRLSAREETAVQTDWFGNYVNRVVLAEKEMGVRNFNVSRYRAVQAFEKYLTF